MKNISLYDYQELMLRRIEAEMAKKSGLKKLSRGGRKYALGRSVLVQMPTGTGKTYVMAAVIQRMKVDGEVWVIAHRRELVEQMEQTLDRFGLEHVEAKDVKDWPKAKVRVMSIQWLSRHIRDVRTQPAMIIIDEAHHAVAPSYQQLWTLFPQARRIGFTATPCRMRQTRFDTLFDELLQSWSIDRFIKEGRLSLYDYVVINRNSNEQHTIDGFERRGADGDYSVTEMDEKMNRAPNIMRLFMSVERYAHGKKGIVYAINRHHAKNIAEYYSRQGIRAVAIDSKTLAAQRMQMVNDFKEGRLDCLVNVNLFDEGFDCPDVEYIQMARPTLSLSKYMQMIGRGLRVHPEKKLCVLIDNVGLYRMFGLPNARRNWERMFYGESAGKGTTDKTCKRFNDIRDVEMEVVAHHSKMTDKQKYYDNVEPFEQNGRWGLRSGETIVLSAVYMMIKPFVGSYCAYSIAEGRWGVLTQRGRVIVGPEYKEVKVLPNATALLSTNGITAFPVDLRVAEADETRSRKYHEEFQRNQEEYNLKQIRLRKGGNR